MSLLSSIQGFGQNFLRDPNGAAVQAPVEMKDIEAFAEKMRVNTTSGVVPAPLENADVSADQPTFDPIEKMGGMVEQVDAAMKAGRAKAHEVLAGESDNLHQSMIAMQEAGVSFNLMLEVRNKMMESYQELMRMSV